ncbi:MAG: peptide ABC transporter substrate-binding protein [Pseudomonadota bacterium]
MTTSRGTGSQVGALGARRMTWRWFALLAVLAALDLTACRRCTDESGARGEPGSAGLSAEADRPLRQITIGIQQEPDTLWPTFHDMMVSEEVLGVGEASLTVFDENWQIQPLAATEIPTLINGGVELLGEGKGMRVTWHLDPELAWPDGTPLTAEDYVFAHELLVDRRYEVAERDIYEKIASMHAEGADHKTLVVEWKEPYAYYHNYQVHPVLPRHIVEPRYRENPDTLINDAFGVLPALAGSFTVAEWVRGSHIIVERNPAARGRWRPWFDRIIFRIIPSTQALEANLVSGTIDAISSGWLPLDRVEALQVQHKDTFDFHYVEGLIFEHIDCNLSNPILADVRVRRALMFATDRERMVHTLVGERQQLAHSWVPPRRPDHNAEVRRYTHDLAEAARLLDEAGYRLGEGGVRHKDGAPLKLSIMTTSGHATREKIEQMLQEDWRKVGIELEIHNQPAKVFFTETLRRRTFPALAMFAWNMDPVADSATLWSCDQVPTQANGWMGRNYTGWCNEEVSAIHQQIARTLDPARRADLLKRQQLLWAEALPVLPLYFRIEPSITVKRLQGWRPTGTLVPVTWNAAQWQFRE